MLNTEIFFTRFPWLSKGNVLARVFKLREELKEILNRQRKYKLESCFRDSTFISKLAYLVDIFDQFNRLNLKLQRRYTIELDFIDTLNAFVQKLKNWKQKAEKGNFAIFETLLSAIEGNLDMNLSSEKLQHLVDLQKEFLTYFPETSDVDLELVKSLLQY